MIRADFKLILIGNPDTGKTSVIKKYTKNIFNEDYKRTIVSEFFFKMFKQNEYFYRIQIWDLSGYDKNGMVTKIYAKDADGFVFVSDATDGKSREE